MTASQKATLNFYQWEYRHRGYHLFDTPVDIEVPYRPFRHTTSQYNSIEDDGRIPSLFKQVTKLLTPPKEEPIQELEEIEPQFLSFESNPNLVSISLSFPRGTETQANRNIEFLNMLSFTEHLISFEIIGTSNSITIQFVCSENDRERVESHLKAYFSNTIIRTNQISDFGFDSENDTAIADFGLNDEYMLSIATTDSFAIDPLTSIIAIMEELQQDDIVVFQILFKGITSPLAKDIMSSVSDGTGGSFFTDAPEMPNCAKDKISYPLFSVVMRIATQGKNNIRSQYLAKELARSISTVSTSEYNKLIPLSNKGYNYDFHKYNLHHRLSNRLGFVLNSKELNTFLHYPNKTVLSKKIGLQGGKTKALPKEAINQKYILGVNEHNGNKQYASISDEIFSKHIVIAGSTGTGKTHLLKQLIHRDLELQNSAFIIDPHGDLVTDILHTISEEKKDDVVYINIADEDFSFGFNIFSASTDAEKTVLASDLVSAFTDTWISSGDRIQSVLQKTISTFIYSTKEASILDMKRFLLEQSFRNEFLQTLDDPILQYYWKNEFPLVRRNELSPLLLRIDSFMQTRLLRNVFCQTKGIDFKELIEQQKLVLIQLSVGLIGLENSKFLARLIISKINQIAFSRQQISVSQRFPTRLYIDESSIYANSPVIEQILSGARKYNLNLVLVLQHLEQVQKDLLNSILTNTGTQIFFRQSDKDSKRIASSFSFFEAEDFMELDQGKALVKINKRSNDFNLTTLPLTQVESSNKIHNYIIQTSQTKYAKNKEYISNLLKTLLPNTSSSKEKRTPNKEVNADKKEAPIIEQPKKAKVIKDSISTTPLVSHNEKAQFLKNINEQEQLRKHRSIQDYIKTMAQQRGFVAKIEEEIKNGARVDVGLTQNNIRIAIEVSVTNSIDYEVSNIEKCLSADYDLVFLVSESEVHRKNIQKRVKKKIKNEDFSKTFYIHLGELNSYLDAIIHKEEKPIKKVNGWRINVNYHPNDTTKTKQDKISKVIKGALKTNSNS